MKNIISYFIKFPLAVNIVMVMVALFGIIGLSRVQRNFFPSVPTRNVYVDILYPGASPEEVEEGAILKIEEEVKGISNMDRITSVSMENSGTVTIEMLKGADMDEALDDVKNAVDRIASFPIDVESVVTYKHDDINFAINFAITAREGKPVDLKVLKETAQQVERDILKMDGISKVELNGYPEEEIAVLLNEDALEAFDLTFSEVAKAVSSTNLVMTGGSIKDGEEEFFIRVRNKNYQGSGLENIVIRNTDNGGVIRLKDVAEIKDQWEDSPSKVLFNGSQAVIVNINTTFDEDIVNASDQIKAYLEKFNSNQPLLYAEVNRDTSVTLNQRIDLLSDNGLMGMVLVMIFLSLFLNPRVAFWVAIGVPFSMLGMLVVLPMTTVTINMMSLFGLILVLGILVDDAIVVAENIYRHFKMGKTPVKSAVDGTMEVLPAVISGVLTTMLAFSAFYFLDGKMGDMFAEISVIVIIILLVSLIEGLIILPSHLAHSKALKDRNEQSKWKKYMSWAEDSLLWTRDNIYVPLFKKAIEFKTVTISVFISLMILAFGFVSSRMVESTFFPSVDGDNFTVTLTMPSGTEEQVTQQALDIIHEAIWEVNEEMKPMQPENKNIISQSFQRFMNSGNKAMIEVTLLDAEVRNGGTEETISRIRKKVGDIAGAETLTYEGFNPFGKSLIISLLGDDNDVLQNAKEDLKKGMRNMPELTDISDNTPVGNREIEIELKEKTHHLGVTIQDVISQVREAFFGNEAQRLQRGKDEVKVWVKYNDDNRKSIGDLEDMKIRLSDGSAYPLSELAYLRMVDGVSSIQHLDFEKEVQLEANQTDPNSSLPFILGKLEKEVLEPLYEKYPGVRASYDGQKREQEKVAKSAKVVIPVVLLLMFTIVVFTLRSVSQAILVYAMIPFSFIGIVFGHWFHGMSMSLMSFMGMIALVGVMINDGLVLINALNINLKSGKNYYDALVEAATSRYRPIILTTLTTVVGMAPMVLETSLQAQFLIPVALSLAYGMVIATLCTLFLLPVMLMIVNRMKVIWKSFKEGRQASAEEVESAIKEMEYEYEEM
ncbi:efflux RND transporter permease subunit [Aureibacter tunicatorum]|uniref:Multidrug efflux pump subunit AcrB n=1 Tax=Aureibacter tunicatorum TaxID=866807 RepID=A0AAE3XRC6_9BACT|nr:efflux RND transporter permease subunit [Aureibacter tunicatorum]MDR6240510.1 multidrug efflux pump subunit AcrB [Aureibacter tunicatorum]BDD06627.1 acriflavin resistance protein [Aureibacter tunicatorum]